MEILLLFIGLFIVGSNQETITEGKTNEVTWQFNFNPQNTDLSCFFQGQYGYVKVVKFKNEVVDKWFSSAKFSNRVSIAAVTHSSVSMRFENVTLNDQGTYVCLYHGWFHTYYSEKRINVVPGLTLSGNDTLELKWTPLPRRCEWTTNTGYTATWLDEHWRHYDTRYFATNTIPGFESVEINSKDTLRMAINPRYCNEYKFACFFDNGSSATYKIYYTGEYY